MRRIRNRAAHQGLAAGTFSVVLHAHLPWVRRAGRWPFGEEWLYQAMLGSYIPLLDLLERLAAQRVRALTLSVTPVLLAMLADPYLQDGFDRYLDERMRLLRRDIVRFKRAGDPRLPLAQSDLSEVEARRERWRTAYGRDLVGVLRSHAERGTVEIIAGAATHAYLPLLLREESVEEQLRVGMNAVVAMLGVVPRGIWLPECGFDPRLAGALERCGYEYFFSDARAVRRRSPRSTLEDFQLAGSSLRVVVRDSRASSQVWSHERGYPGDRWYREFHRQDERSGNRYWRVTDKAADLDAKKLYEPARAREQAASHAAHFVRAIEKRLSSYRRRSSRGGHCVVAFDAELFGHWWAEGPLWLETMLRGARERGRVALHTVGRALSEKLRPTAVALPASSWGVGGDHRTWDNESVRWLRESTDRADAELGALAPLAGLAPATYLQLRREALLLQSSDWAFLITSGQAPDYAARRFRDHLARFDALAASLRSTAADTDETAAAFMCDTLFADHMFARPS